MIGILAQVVTTTDSHSQSVSYPPSFFNSYVMLAIVLLAIGTAIGIVALCIGRACSWYEMAERSGR